MPRLAASLRPRFRIDTMLFAEVAKRVSLMNRAKEGAATAARIAAIVTVISNSVSVKPVSFLIGRFTAFASVYRPARNCDAGARFADLEILAVQTISKPVLVGYDIQGQRLSGSSDKGSIVNGLSDLHAAGPDLVTDLSVHLTNVVVSTTNGIPRHLRDTAYARNESPRRAPDPEVIDEHGREALIDSLRDAAFKKYAYELRQY